MIGYFPAPLPDELFSSVIARYVCHVGRPRLRGLNHELTGKKFAMVDIRFASSLAYLVDNLPPSHGAQVEDLLDLHTLLPLYASALTTSATRELRDWMIEAPAQSQASLLSGQSAALDEYDTVGGRMFWRASVAPFVPFFRFCPRCAAEDLQTYGECYWHRLHHIYGINICYKHSVYLLEGTHKVPRRLRYLVLGSCNADLALLRNDSTLATFPVQSVNLDKPGVRLQMQLLSDVAWLLNKPSTKAPLLSLRRRTLGCAMKNAVLQRLPGGGLEVDTLAHAAEEMLSGAAEFGDETVSQMVRNVAKTAWWHRVIAGQCALGDPLPWLIMIRAAGSTVETVLHPYADGNSD